MPRGEPIIAGVATTLREAKAILRVGWCVGVNASTAEGYTCGIMDDEAASWDVAGALYRAGYNRNVLCVTTAGRLIVSVLLGDVQARPWAAVREWNDDQATTPEKIQSVLEKAAKIADKGLDDPVVLEAVEASRAALRATVDAQSG